MRHLNDANGSCEETKVGFTFARDCKFLEESVYMDLYDRYNRIGAMLNSLAKNWKHY